MGYSYNTETPTNAPTNAPSIPSFSPTQIPITISPTQSPDANLIVLPTVSTASPTGGGGEIVETVSSTAYTTADESDGIDSTNLGDELMMLLIITIAVLLCCFVIFCIIFYILYKPKK